MASWSLAGVDHFTGEAFDLGDRDEFSLTRFTDDFDRELSDQWGGPWSDHVHAFVRNGYGYLDGTETLPIDLPNANVQLLAAGSIDLQIGSARAELRDDSLAIIENGDELARMPLPHGAHWLRFQVDDTSINARAWLTDADEPTDWLTAASPHTAGPISLTTQGLVGISHVRVQQLGLSIHARVRLDPEQPASRVQILGKGDRAGLFTWSDEQEYHLRLDADQKLKWYVFDTEGGYGAGQATTIDLDHTYDLVLELLPGDFRDRDARVVVYVDGAEVPDDAGAHYQSSPCTPSHEVCWSIDPRPTNAQLRVGTSDGDSYANVWIDDVAIYDRLLTADEITSIPTNSP
ncbi:MAG: hypothetical protein QM831_06030 [Kofleriaceae bacterium]